MSIAQSGHVLRLCAMLYFSAETSRPLRESVPALANESKTSFSEPESRAQSSIINNDTFWLVGFGIELSGIVCGCVRTEGIALHSFCLPASIVHAWLCGRW